MSRRLLMILVALVAISMIAVGCPPPAEEEEEEEPPVGRTKITLDFATFWPAIDFQVTMGHHKWAETISSRVMAETTNWTVEWNWYYSIAPGALRTGVKAGTYDVITSGPGYYAGVYPLWEGPEYAGPLCRKNALTCSMACQRLWETFAPLRAEVAAKDPDVQIMHYWSTGPGYFLMTMGKNITRLEDFPGKRIRVANPASNITVSALGGIPEYMPMSAALLAFQAGTIDGILCPTDTPKGFGLSAFVRSLTFAPFSYQFVFWKVMNKATYDGLPAEVRAIIDSVNAKYPEYYGKLRTWGELDGIGFCRSSLGWNVSWFEYYLPTADPTEYARWVSACYPSLIDAWIGGNTTRAHLWGNYTALDAYYCATPPWGNWTPGVLGGPPMYTSPPPPTPPTFP